MNKLLVWAFTIALQVLASKAASKEVSCESTSSPDWPILGPQKTCFMYGATTIDSVETTMTSSRDETIHGLTFNVNKKILFAPLEVAISFPNLAGYSLYSCSIKTVAKRHFKDLVKLRALWLARNQIKEIASDTFDDLVSLEFLNLSDNKIKSLNGELFLGLNHLTNVELSNNECINENFSNKNRVASLPEVATKKCGFVELGNFIEKYEATCVENLTSLTSENTQNLIKIATLEAKLGAAVAAETKADSKANLIQEIYEKLDAQRNLTFEIKTEELRNTLELKLQEISDLLDAKQELEDTSREKDQKLEKLEKKIEIINNNCNF